MSEVAFSVPDEDGMTPWRLAHLLLNRGTLLGSGAYALAEDEENQDCVRIFLADTQVGAVHFTNHRTRLVQGRKVKTVEGVTSDSTPEEFVSCAATALIYEMPEVFRQR